MLAALLIVFTATWIDPSASRVDRRALLNKSIPAGINLSVYRIAEGGNFTWMSKRLNGWNHSTIRVLFDV